MNNQNLSREEQFLQATINNNYDSKHRIRQILQLGVQVNYQDEEGRTALMYAAINGNHEIIECLRRLHKVKVKADIQDMYGKTALMYAMEGLDSNYLGLLIPSRNSRQNFSVSDRNYMNIRDKKGMNALMHAATSGMEGNLRFMCKYFGDINATDHDEKTALHHACIRGSVPCLKTLLEFGADFTIPDADGRNPLMYCCIHGQMKCMESILENSIENIESCDNHGNTCAMLACENNNDECLKLFKDAFSRKDIDINARNVEGKTCLIIAAENGSQECIVWILELIESSDIHVEIDAKDKNGENAFARICKARNEGDAIDFYVRARPIPDSILAVIVERQWHRMLSHLYLDNDSSEERASISDQVSNLNSLQSLECFVRSNSVPLAKILIEGKNRDYKLKMLKCAQDWDSGEIYKFLWGILFPELELTGEIPCISYRYNKNPKIGVIGQNRRTSERLLHEMFGRCEVSNGIRIFQRKESLEYKEEEIVTTLLCMLGMDYPTMKRTQMLHELEILIVCFSRGEMFEDLEREATNAVHMIMGISRPDFIYFLIENSDMILREDSSIVRKLNKLNECNERNIQYEFLDNTDLETLKLKIARRWGEEKRIFPVLINQEQFIEMRRISSIWKYSEFLRYIRQFFLNSSPGFQDNMNAQYLRGLERDGEILRIRNPETGDYEYVILDIQRFLIFLNKILKRLHHSSELMNESVLRKLFGCSFHGEDETEFQFLMNIFCFIRVALKMSDNEDRENTWLLNPFGTQREYICGLPDATKTSFTSIFPMSENLLDNGFSCGLRYIMHNINEDKFGEIMFNGVAMDTLQEYFRVVVPSHRLTYTIQNTAVDFVIGNYNIHIHLFFSKAFNVYRNDGKYFIIDLWSLYENDEMHIKCSSQLMNTLARKIEERLVCYQSLEPDNKFSWELVALYPKRMKAKNCCLWEILENCCRVIYNTSEKNAAYKFNYSSEIDRMYKFGSEEVTEEDCQKLDSFMAYQMVNVVFDQMKNDDKNSRLLAEILTKVQEIQTMNIDIVQTILGMYLDNLIVDGGDEDFKEEPALFGYKQSEGFDIKKNQRLAREQLEDLQDNWLNVLYDEEDLSADMK